MIMGLNEQYYKHTHYLDGQSPDGTKFSKNPRANPAQAPIPIAVGGQIVTYQETLTAVSVATITTAEQALTVGTTAGNGPATTDFLAAVNKPTAQAGLGVQTGRISAANTITLTYSNTSAGWLTPTAAEIYNVVTLRGAPTHIQSLTPALVPADSSSETVFNITQTQPSITLTVDGYGRINSATLVTAGTGFYQVPTLIVVDSQGGAGALLRCDVTALGVIDRVWIEDAGEGYVAPTVTAIGGNIIEKGMLAMVTKPTVTAGIAISNVRVVENNQIAIQFVNATAANVTPTAENYTICCLNEIPAISNVVSYGMQVGTLALCAANTTAEQSVTLNGILATDIAVGCQKPTLQAGICVSGVRVSAANTMGVGIGNFTAGNLTPTAAEIYGLTIYRQNPEAPLKIFRPILSPVSVAANTSAEETFTVTGLPAGATVVVNKPSHQPGLAISGFRVTAANTLGITFMNVTAAAITPTASEQYTVGCFMAVGAGGGVPGSLVALPFDLSLQRAIEQTQEQQAVMNETGLANGA
jgi:hypothetical protein